MTYRERMIESNENLSWCKPLSFLNGRIVIAVNEGEIVGIQLDGKDISVNDENITSMAKMANDSFDNYSGYYVTDILLDAEFKEKGCKDCPWFNICDAMDEE